MPTGLTQPIENAKNYPLRSFLLQCARQFGYCAHMRDTDLEVEPTLRPPSTYNVRELKKAERKYKEMLETPDKELRKLYTKEVQARKALIHKVKRENALKKERYNQMRAAVTAWVPPTKEHQSLKEFALSQIEDSDEHSWVPSPLPGFKIWKQQRKSSLRSDIAYHRQELEQDETHRVRANDWIRALYASLDSK